MKTKDHKDVRKAITVPTTWQHHDLPCAVPGVLHSFFYRRGRN